MSLDWTDGWIDIQVKQSRPRKLIRQVAAIDLLLYFGLCHIHTRDCAVVYIVE